MPRIEMKTISAGPGGNYSAGQKITVDKKEAKEFVDGGYAVYVDSDGEPISKKKETAKAKAAEEKEKAKAKAAEAARIKTEKAKADAKDSK